MFPDVPEDHWAAKDIADVTNWGLVAGYPDGTFGPERPITRAELAAVVRRLVDATPANRVVFEAMHSVVFVMSSFSKQGSRGSGVWVAPWLFLTNAHVVTTKEGEQASLIRVVGCPQAGFSEVFIGKIERVWDEYDLALVKVASQDRDCPVIELASVEPDVADPVWALGAPFGQPWDTSGGTVRHKNRTLNYWKQPQRLWGLDLSINPGNSGGALVDVRGQLCGVPSAGFPEANDFTFAVPLPTVRQVLTEAGLL